MGYRIPSFCRLRGCFCHHSSGYLRTSGRDVCRLPYLYIPVIYLFPKNKEWNIIFRGASTSTLPCPLAELTSKCTTSYFHIPSWSFERSEEYVPLLILHEPDFRLQSTRISYAQRSHFRHYQSVLTWLPRDRAHPGFFLPMWKILQWI